MTPETPTRLTIPSPIPQEGRIPRFLAWTVGAAALLVVLGWVLGPERFFFAWLTAVTAGLSVALGALALLLASRVVDVPWLRPMRPELGAAVATLPLLALLFLAVLPGLDVLYPWAAPPEGMDPALRVSLERRRYYLNVPSFVARSLLYLGVWSAAAWLLGPWRSGGTWDRGASAALLPVLAFTGTFAAFDWLMSLSPEWFSTAYGLYYLVGGFSAALGLLALGSWLARRSPLSEGSTEAEEPHALGRMLLASVVLWGFVAYSQLLVYWMGNIPDRIAWYVPRLDGSWGVLAVVVALGRCIVPFLVLLPRRLRSDPRVLAGVGALVLVMHYLDLYWLVMPELESGGVAFHWLDVAALLVVVGSAALVAVAALSGEVAERSGASMAVE